jgi:hypothetical protein
MRRCIGLTRNLTRCLREGDWNCFCYEHRRQPIVWAFGAVFTVAAGIASMQSAWFRRPDGSKPQKTVEANVSPRSPTIALNCEVMTQPVPWANTIKVLELMPGLQKGWVLESSLVRRRTREWPEPFRPNETYTCKIGNFSDFTVFDVETVFGLTFKKAVKADPQLNSKSLKSAETVTTQEHSISLPLIESGETVVFYVRNPTQYFVQVSLPPTWQTYNSREMKAIVR